MKILELEISVYILLYTFIAIYGTFDSFRTFGSHPPYFVKTINHWRLCPNGDYGKDRCRPEFKYDCNPGYSCIKQNKLSETDSVYCGVCCKRTQFCPPGQIQGPVCSFNKPCPFGYSCDHGVCCLATMSMCPLGSKPISTCHQFSDCLYGAMCVHGTCCAVTKKVSLCPSKLFPLAGIRCKHNIHCPGSSGCYGNTCCQSKFQMKHPQKKASPIFKKKALPLISGQVGRPPNVLPKILQKLPIHKQVLNQPHIPVKPKIRRPVVPPNIKAFTCPVGYKKLPDLTCTHLSACPGTSECISGVCCSKSVREICPVHHRLIPDINCSLRQRCQHGSKCISGVCCLPLRKPPSCPRGLVLASDQTCDQGTCAGLGICISGSCCRVPTPPPVVKDPPLLFELPKIRPVKSPRRRRPLLSTRAPIRLTMAPLPVAERVTFPTSLEPKVGSLPKVPKFTNTNNILDPIPSVSFFGPSTLNVFPDNINMMVPTNSPVTVPSINVVKDNRVPQNGFNTPIFPRNINIVPTNPPATLPPLNHILNGNAVPQIRFNTPLFPRNGNLVPSNPPATLPSNNIVNGQPVPQRLFNTPLFPQRRNIVPSNPPATNPSNNVVNDIIPRTRFNTPTFPPIASVPGMNLFPLNGGTATSGFIPPESPPQFPHVNRNRNTQAANPSMVTLPMFPLIFPNVVSPPKSTNTLPPPLFIHQGLNVTPRPSDRVTHGIPNLPFTFPNFPYFPNFPNLPPLAPSPKTRTSPPTSLKTTPPLLPFEPAVDLTSNPFTLSPLASIFPTFPTMVPPSMHQLANDLPVVPTVNNSPTSAPVNAPKGIPPLDFPSGFPTFKFPSTAPNFNMPSGFPSVNFPPSGPSLNNPSGFPPINFPPSGPSVNNPSGFPSVNFPPSGPSLNNPSDFPPINFPPSGPSLNNPSDFPPVNFPPSGPSLNNPSDFPPVNFPPSGPSVNNPSGFPSVNFPPSGPSLNNPSDFPPINFPPSGPSLNNPSGFPPINFPPSGPSVNNPSGFPSVNFPPSGPSLNNPSDFQPINFPPSGPSLNNPSDFPPVNFPPSGPSLNNPSDFPPVNFPPSGPSLNNPSAFPPVNFPPSGPSPNNPSAFPPVNFPPSGPSPNNPSAFPPVNFPKVIPPVNDPNDIPLVNIPPSAPTLNNPFGIPPADIPKSIPQVNLTDGITPFNFPFAFPTVTFPSNIPSFNNLPYFPFVNIPPVVQTGIKTITTTSNVIPKSTTKPGILPPVKTPAAPFTPIQPLLPNVISNIPDAQQVPELATPSIREVSLIPTTLPNIFVPEYSVTMPPLIPFDPAKQPFVPLFPFGPDINNISKPPPAISKTRNNPMVTVPPMKPTVFQGPTTIPIIISKTNISRPPLTITPPSVTVTRPPQLIEIPILHDAILPPVYNIPIPPFVIPPSPTTFPSVEIPLYFPTLIPTPTSSPILKPVIPRFDPTVNVSNGIPLSNATLNVPTPPIALFDFTLPPVNPQAPIIPAYSAPPIIPSVTFPPIIPAAVPSPAGPTFPPFIATLNASTFVTTPPTIRNVSSNRNGSVIPPLFPGIIDIQPLLPKVTVTDSPLFPFDITFSPIIPMATHFPQMPPVLPVPSATAHPNIIDTGPIFAPTVLSPFNFTNPFGNPNVPINNVSNPFSNTTFPFNNVSNPFGNANVPFNNVSKPFGNTNVPFNNVSKPSNNTYPINDVQVPINNFTLPSKNATLPPLNLTNPTSKVTQGPFKFTLPPFRPTHPPFNNSMPFNTTMPYNSTYPYENSTYPYGNWTYPFDNSTYPDGNWTYPFDNSTYPNGNWTYPFDNSTYPYGNWTYPFDNSTYPYDNYTYTEYYNTTSSNLNATPIPRVNLTKPIMTKGNAPRANVSIQTTIPMLKTAPTTGSMNTTLPPTVWVTLTPVNKSPPTATPIASKYPTSSTPTYIFTFPTAVVDTPKTQPTPQIKVNNSVEDPPITFPPSVPPSTPTTTLSPPSYPTTCPAGNITIPGLSCDRIFKCPAGSSCYYGFCCLPYEMVQVPACLVDFVVTPVCPQPPEPDQCRYDRDCGPFMTCCLNSCDRRVCRPTVDPKPSKPR